jgi:hypothetical protein
MTLDVAGDIVLDADGGDVFVKDAGTTFGSLTNTSGNLIIKSGTTTAATFSGANVTLAGTVASGAITASGLITANANVTLAGTTPILTIGDAGAEDTKIQFDGNAQDFYIGLDDSGDEFQIGRGSTLGAGREFSIGASGPVFNEDSDTHDFRIETDDQTHALFIHGANDEVSINESASDTDAGGLCINHGSNDAFALTLKNSDVAHGITGHAETDTYATFRKIDNADGGIQIHGLGEANQAVRINGICPTVNTAKSNASSTVAPIILEAALKSGTGSGDISANGNILVVKMNGGSKFLVDEDGDIHYDGADQGAFDTYEDAQLVRALDLSRDKNLAGVINSKFDDYVEYNHETLANAKLVGREEDGTPNHFVNITGMQRLHNGAIWQQYEKTQKLTQAMYKLAQKTLGKEEADKLLDEEEIKLLN